MANQNASEKDKQIIRQSQLKLSLDYFNHCGICPSIVDLMKTTTMLEDFVINGYSKEMVSKFENLDIYIKETYGK